MTGAVDDDPASRLHEILQEARSSAGPVQADRSWCQIFHIEDTDLSGLLVRSSEVVRLGQEVRELVSALPLPEKPRLILRHFSEIETVLSRFPSVGSMTMAEFMGGLSAPGLSSLKLASAALMRKGGGPALNADVVFQLLEKARVLINEVADAKDLAPPTKRYIIDCLKNVEDSLINVKLSGPGATQRAADRLTGGVLGLPTDLWKTRSVRAVGRFTRDLIVATSAILLATQLDRGPVPQATQPVPSEVVITYLIERTELPELTPSRNPDPAASDRRHGRSN